MVEERPERPDIFEYLDFRTYLRDSFAFIKAEDGKFSHRFIAGKVGVRSSGFFRDVLNGRSRLSHARIFLLAKCFKLDEKESEFFSQLVWYNQSTKEDEKKHYLEKLMAFSGHRKGAILKAFQMEYFRKWYYVAIREALAFVRFKGNYQTLANSLEPAITENEAMEAVQLLLKLGLIQKNSQGEYERTSPIVRTDPKGDLKLTRDAFKQTMALADRAMEKFPRELRPFAFLTISVSDNSLKKINEKLRQTRKEILEIVSRDSAVDRLYQLNMHMFPISHNADFPEEKE